VGKPNMEQLLNVMRPTLPQVYVDHHVVRTVLDEPVYPLSLYTDGVAFGRNDTVLGFYIYNLVTGVRHCLVALRKSEMCKCGCRGWCSLLPVFTMLHWSLMCLAAGRFPQHRHDGAPFNTSSDSERSVIAGDRMGFRAILLFIKGDWSEYATSFGFPTWASNLAPCILCTANKDNKVKCS
jgi:hypothetical protein